MTVLDLTSLLMAAARMGREGGKGAKKAELCTLMLSEVTNTYQANECLDDGCGPVMERSCSQCHLGT